MTPSRRQFLAAAGAAGLPGVLSTARAAGPRPAVRVAHFTDLHITDDRSAPRGAAAMFAHMAARGERRPELVLNTGDSVMAVNGKVTGDRAAVQIALWREAVKSSPAPIRSCLGNHDVWDGAGPTAAVPADRRGFALMSGVLGLPAPYYSFDHGGWHFVALNSVAAWPKMGTLGAAQFDWLKADLAANRRPTVVFSHLPILSVTSLVYGDEQRKGNDVVVPGDWQHADCWAITEVFRRNPQVKLCLSGHMHTCDRAEYRGVWYVCGGAASGAWWEGSEFGFPPCYGALDLFADGAFTYEFVDYGWTARGWKGQEFPL